MYIYTLCIVILDVIVERICLNQNIWCSIFPFLAGTVGECRICAVYMRSLCYESKKKVTLGFVCCATTETNDADISYYCWRGQ